MLLTNLYSWNPS